MRKITAENIRDYIGQVVTREELSKVKELYLILSDVHVETIKGGSRYSGILAYVGEEMLESKMANGIEIKNSIVIYNEEPFEDEDYCYDE